MRSQTVVSWLVGASVLFLAAAPGSGELVLYEPFDYAVGAGLAGREGQTFVQGSTGGPSGTGRFWGQQAPNGNYWMSCALSGTYDPNTDALIVTNDLSVAGLAQLPGTKAVQFGGPGITSRLAFTPIYAALDGSPVPVYYSFAFRIPAGGLDSTSPDGGLVAALNNTRGSQPGNPSTEGCAMCVKPSGAGFVVGVNENSTASFAATYDTTVLNFDTTYFVVGKYTIRGVTNYLTQDDDAQIWINPDPGTFGGAEPSGAVVALAPQNDIPTNMGDSNAVVQTFVLRQDGTGSGANAATSIIFDELRVGTTYAEVTPAPPRPAPQLIAIAGAGTTSVTVTWTNVQVGTNYVLQYNTNLASTDWTDLAPVTAAGTTASQTDAPPNGQAARFYRVVKP